MKTTYTLTIKEATLQKAQKFSVQTGQSVETICEGFIEALAKMEDSKPTTKEDVYKMVEQQSKIDKMLKSQTAEFLYQTFVA